ncbi:hypothetical protein [Brevibacillus borstelensis]|uniref:hypothetical protein n=1 Tax=Brevibacillus borstelensis TaxID=45462 RepID=UPI0030BF7E08
MMQHLQFYKTPLFVAVAQRKGAFLIWPCLALEGISEKRPTGKEGLTNRRFDSGKFEKEKSLTDHWSGEK